jgi:hypothetical protein
MEVPSPSFPKTQVPSKIRIETEVPKNKVFKTQVLKTYLTLIFFDYAFKHILTIGNNLIQTSYFEKSWASRPVLTQRIVGPKPRQ